MKTKNITTMTLAARIAYRAQLKVELAKLKAAVEEVDASLLEELGPGKHFGNDHTVITVVGATTVQTLDGKALKADHPDLVARYMRQQTRKAYIK